MAQGLAYMHHSFVSAYISDPETNNSRSVGNLGKGTSDPFDVLEKVKPQTASLTKHTAPWAAYQTSGC